MTTPLRSAPNRRRAATLTGIYLGLAALIVVSSGFSTFLPAAAADIGGVELYPLASGLAGVLGVAAMPMFGYFGARRPDKKPVMLAAALLGGAIILIVRATAVNMVWVIGASVFWGLASGAMFVLGYSLIRELFEKEKAGVLLGVVGTVTSVGVLIGPVLTGFIIDTAGWRLVYHFVWPFMVVAVLLIFFGARPPQGESAKHANFDFVGACLLTVGLTALVLALSLGSTYVPFGSLVSNALFAVTALALAALALVIRRKRAAAILPTPVLTDRNTLALFGVVTLSSFSAMAVFFFMPSYVLFVLGGSALEAGLATAFLAVAGLGLGPVLGSWMAKRNSARGVILFGTLVRIAVTVALLLVLTPSTPLWVLYLIMLIAGVYNSQQSVTASAAPQIQIAPSLRVMGNSLIQVGQVLGAGLGLAVFTTIIGAMGPEAGTPIALITAIVAAVGVGASALFLREPTASGVAAASR